MIVVIKIEWLLWKRFVRIRLNNNIEHKKVVEEEKLEENEVKAL